MSSGLTEQFSKVMGGIGPMDVTTRTEGGKRRRKSSRKSKAKRKVRKSRKTKRKGRKSGKSRK
jgi:hypothetical protein